MKNLFLQEADFGADVPVVSLPPDKAQWDFFLQQELLKRFPPLYGKPMEVKMQDSQEDAAYGAVTVKLSPKEDDSLVFPIIIKENKMYPPDIVCYGDKFLKATEDNISQILNKEAIDLGAHKERPDANGLEDINFVTPDQNLNILNPGSVFSGKSVVASAANPNLLKNANLSSYVDRISALLPAIENSLEKRPFAKKAFQQFVSKAKEQLKTATLVTLPPALKSASLRYLPSKSSYELTTVSVDTSKNKLASCTKTVESLESALSELKYLTNSDDVVKNAADRMKVANDFDVGVKDEGAEIVGEPDVAQSADASPVKVVFDNTGNAHTGVVVEHVIDFDLNKLPTKLFLCKDKPGMYAFAETIEGRPAADQKPELHKLTSPVEQGLTVSFLICDDEAVIATFPFKVLSVKSFNGHTAYVGSFVMRGEPVTLLPSLITKSICPIAKEDLGEMAQLANTDKVYAIPADIKAVSLDAAIPLESVKSGCAKFIFKQTARTPEKLARATRYGDNLKIQHPDFSEPLFGKTALSALGAGDLYEKVKTAAAQTKEVLVLLPGYKSPRFKIARLSPTKPLKFDPDVFIKAAAGINDENLSMLNLSLGLSDTSDSFKFSEYIDLFKDTVDKLSRLMLASRLGMDMSDSAAIKLAIDALDSIINQLRTL